MGLPLMVSGNEKGGQGVPSVRMVEGVSAINNCVSGWQGLVTDSGSG